MLHYMCNSEKKEPVIRINLKKITLFVHLTQGEDGRDGFGDAGPPGRKVALLLFCNVFKELIIQLNFIRIVLQLSYNYVTFIPEKKDVDM